jgi:hypothetical protein
MVVNSKSRVLLAVLSLSLLLTIEGSAQVKFVQITDPHIFDDETPEDRENDKEALSAAVQKINERLEQGANYDFVVITGDLGIEALIVKKGTKPSLIDEAATADNLKQKAMELSDILKQSKVKRWMFVAGNNDLDDEQPGTIKYYNSFIEALGGELKDKAVTDLSRDGEVGVSMVNGFSFVGFNDASFKNQNDASRLKCVPEEKEKAADEQDYPIHAKQLGEVQSVHDRLKKADIRLAYIFYHIPEIDDPYLIRLKPDNEDIKAKSSSAQCIGEENIYSPWFVNKRIRDEWNQVVKEEKVKGLFAGHFHDSWRETYLNNHWMRSAAYLSGSLSKLYVCPPLAVKFQENAKEQARGFQEVSIDGDGNILDAAKKNGVHIFWYDQQTKTFNTDFDDEKERQAIDNLKLGQLFENSGRMREAEEAYTKALASNSPLTRQRASEALNGVVAKQSSPWNRYLLTQWPLSPEGSILLTAVILLLLSLAVLSGDKVSFAYRGRPLSPTMTAVSVVTVAISIWILLWLANRFFLRGWKASLSSNVAVLLTALVIALSLGVLQQVLWGRGRGRLLIIPLVDVTEHKLGGTFPQLFSMTREDILLVRNSGMIIPTSPPIIVIGEDAEIVELVESSVGGARGKIIAWFLRKAMRPEYSLRGTLQPAGLGATEGGPNIYRWLSAVEGTG